MEGPIVEPASWLDALKLGRSQNRFGSSSSPSGKKKSGGFVQWIRGNVFIPDARMFWIRPSIRRLKKQLKEHPVDAIVSTGPPHSTHLIALGLKQAFPDIPWVADFRDPWSDMDYLDDFNLTARSRARHKALERNVVEHADRVVVTAPSAASSILGRPLQDNDPKGVWIPNGYDAADGFDLEMRLKTGPLCLASLGRCMAAETPPGCGVPSGTTTPVPKPPGLCIWCSTAPSTPPSMPNWSKPCPPTRGGSQGASPTTRFPRRCRLAMLW